MSARHTVKELLRPVTRIPLVRPVMKVVIQFGNGLRVKVGYYLLRRRAKTIVFLLASARSGSHLLMDYLRCVPDTVVTEGVLSWNGFFGIRRRFISKETVMRHVEYSMNKACKVCVTKIMDYQLEARHIDVEDLRQRFPDAKYVVLYRGNLAEQFVSELVHHQTHTSFSTSNKRAFKGKVHVDRDDLLQYFQTRKDGYQRLLSLEWFRSCSTIVKYEDLAARPNQVFAEQLLPLLQLPSCRVTTNLKKQNTRAMSEIIENYGEVADLLESDVSRQEYSSA